MSSITVVSYFNGKNERVCDFRAERGSSEQEILDLARDAISSSTRLPGDLLTLKFSAGYVHILNKSAPKTRTQCDAEIQRCQLRRKKSGEWLERALSETRERAKDFKENKTKDSSNT